jgi:hypothetical protein
MAWVQDNTTDSGVRWVQDTPSTYDSGQSMSANVAGLGSLGGLENMFIGPIQTAFAAAGRPDYGGQDAHKLITDNWGELSNIISRSTNPSNDVFNFANSVLQRAGMRPFSSVDEWSAANRSLPGHNVSLSPFNPIDVVKGVGETASDLWSEPGFRALALTAGAGSLMGPGATPAAATDAQLLSAAGITPTYAPSGFMTVGGTEAAAAGATPWLSNAPAGSVFSAGAATPAVVGGGLAGALGTAGVGAAAANGGAIPSGASTQQTVTNTPQGTSLSRMLGISPDLLSVLGIAGATGLGMYGANQQADALRGIAEQGRADRAPFLNKSLEYLNNPEAYYSGPGQASLNATLRALSATHGNPIGSPTALGIATEAGMRDWRNAVTGFGNMGLAGEDTRASLMSQATGADANTLNALGWGLDRATQPRTLEEALRRSGFTISLA